MLLKLRIYRRHDIDLLALVAHSTFDFPNEVKKCLRNYIHNYPAVIILPKTQEYGRSVHCFASQIHIKLDDDLDADIIELIKGIPSGLRNCFVKNLFRNMIERPYTEAYTANIIYKNRRTNTSVKPIDADKIASDIINTETVRPTSPVYIETADNVLKKQ